MAFIFCINILFLQARIINVSKLLEAIMNIAAYTTIGFTTKKIEY